LAVKIRLMRGEEAAQLPWWSPTGAARDGRFIEVLSVRARADPSVVSIDPIARCTG
jgi:hypothetical protein